MTTVVVDANLSLAQALPLPYSGQAALRMKAWMEENAHIAVPSLWEYELVSGLRRACTTGWLTTQSALQSLEQLLLLDFEVVPNTPERHRRSLVWAERLEQARAYDAQYLALAEQLGAEFWTADQRLANRSRQVGAAWVYWISEGEA